MLEIKPLTLVSGFDFGVLISEHVKNFMFLSISKIQIFDDSQKQGF